MSRLKFPRLYVSLEEDRSWLFFALYISEIRKLKRPLPCIIEHIKAEPAELAKTKTWVEKQLQF